MRFWSREIGGWVLVFLGLFCFYLCYAFLVERLVVQAIPMTVIGIFVFRGGIHLLKVALAARICLEARETSSERQEAAARRPVVVRPQRAVLPTVRPAP